MLVIYADCCLLFFLFVEFQSESDGRPGEGMMTLEELNEKIITMTDKLAKMKELRDKMLSFSQNYANELRSGNNAQL